MIDFLLRQIDLGGDVGEIKIGRKPADMIDMFMRDDNETCMPKSLFEAIIGRFVKGNETIATLFCIEARIDDAGRAIGMTS